MLCQIFAYNENNKITSLLNKSKDRFNPIEARWGTSALGDVGRFVRLFTFLPHRNPGTPYLFLIYHPDILRNRPIAAVFILSFFSSSNSQVEDIS
jgi:hypothetical protein